MIFKEFNEYKKRVKIKIDNFINEMKNSLTKQLISNYKHHLIALKQVIQCSNEEIYDINNTICQIENISNNQRPLIGKTQSIINKLNVLFKKGETLSNNNINAEKYITILEKGIIEQCEVKNKDIKDKKENLKIKDTINIKQYEKLQLLYTKEKNEKELMIENSKELAKELQNVLLNNNNLQEVIDKERIKNKDIDNLRELYEKGKEEIKELKNCNLLQIEKIKEIEDIKNKEINEFKEANEQKLKQKEKEVNDIKQKLDKAKSIEDKCKEMKNNINKLQDEAKVKDNINIQLKKQIDELNKKLKEKESELNLKIKTHKEQIDNIQKLQSNEKVQKDQKQNIIIQLQNQIDQTESKRKKIEKEKLIETQKFKQKEDEYNKLKTQFDQLSLNYQSVHKEAKEKELYSKQLDNTNKEILNLKKIIDNKESEYKDAIIEKDKEINKFSDSLNKIKLQLNKGEENVKGLIIDLQNKEEEISLVKQSNDKKLKDLNEEINKYKDQYKALEIKIKQANNTIYIKIKENEQLILEVKEKEKTINSQIKEIEKITQNNIQQSELIRTLSDKKSQLEKDNQRLNNKIQEERILKVKKEKDYYQKEEELNQLKSQNIELNTKIQMLNTENKNLILKKEEDIGIVQNENNTLKIKIEELCNVTQENKQLKEKIEQLNKLKPIINEVEIKNDEVNKLKDDNRKLLDEIDKLKSIIESVKKENHSVNKDIQNNLEINIKKLIEENQLYKVENKALKSKNEEITNEYKNITNTKNILESKNNLLKSSIESLKQIEKENATLHKQIELNNLELTKYKDQYNILQSDKETLNTQLHTVQLENSELKLQIEQYKKREKDLSNKSNDKISILTSSDVAITNTNINDNLISNNTGENTIANINTLHLKEKISHLESAYTSAKKLIETQRINNEETNKLLQKCLDENKKLREAQMNSNKHNEDQLNIDSLKDTKIKNQIITLIKENFPEIIKEVEIEKIDEDKISNLLIKTDTALKIIKQKCQKYKEAINKLTKKISEDKKEQSNLNSIQSDLLKKLNQRDLQIEEYKKQIDSLLKESKDKNTIPLDKYQQVLQLFTQEEEKYKKDIERLKMENDIMKKTYNQNLNTDVVSSSSADDDAKRNYKFNNIMSQPNVTNALMLERNDTRGSQYSVVVEEIEKNLESSEELFKEQLKVLKDELKKAKKDLEYYKKLSLTVEGGKTELSILLKQTFQKLLQEIQVNNKNKDYIVMMMRVIGYTEEEIKDINKKGKKNFLGLFK